MDSKRARRLTQGKEHVRSLKLWAAGTCSSNENAVAGHERFEHVRNQSSKIALFAACLRVQLRVTIERRP